MTVQDNLAVLGRFVNTLDVETGTDAFTTPDQLRAWLVEQGWASPGERVTQEDLERALRFREAVRDLARGNTGHRPHPSSLALLAEVGRSSHLGVMISPEGHATLAPCCQGVESLLERLLAIIYTAMAQGTWQRLKACHNDECEWVFLDRSKNRSRRWCTMQACGNVMNARAYRARRRAE